MGADEAGSRIHDTVIHLLQQHSCSGVKPRLAALMAVLTGGTSHSEAQNQYEQQQWRVIATVAWVAFTRHLD